MHATEYIPLALRTAKWFSGPGPDMTAIHAALGLMSEAGELSEVFLAQAVEVELPNHGREYHNAMLEELGGFAWFLAYAAQYHHEAIFDRTGVPANPEHILGADYGLHDSLPEGHRWFGLLGGDVGDILPWVAGEYGTLVKASAVYGKPMDYAKLHQCLYLMGAALNHVADTLDVDLSEVYDYNINQLRARYPDKFTDELAIARLDKQEPESEGGTPD